MLDARLYLAQRISALLMAPLVLGHLALMIWAVRGGLSVAEILGRTQGSMLWFSYYGLFVVAVSVHAAIGLRVVAYEWFRLPQRWLAAFTGFTLVLLLFLGARAVWAVTFA